MSSNLIYYISERKADHESFRHAFRAVLQSNEGVGITERKDKGRSRLTFALMTAEDSPVAIKLFILSKSIEHYWRYCYGE